MVHPETQVEEEDSVHEITVFENNESETTTPGGQAPPLEAVAAEEDDNNDDDYDLSVFTRRRGEIARPVVKGEPRS